MAWRRDEANLGISGATAYSYTECDWEVHGEYCSYRHIGGVTSPYGFNASATADGEWWDGSWHDYYPEVTGSGTFSGYGDLKLFDITDTFARQAQDRLVSVGTSASMMGGSARSYIDYTVPHKAPAVTWASSNPVVRNSDNSITLNWNAPALEYSALCLEVSIDGGSWSQFAVLWNTATTYTLTECSADHSYQFRIRSNYLASYSAYDTCATVILMTPSMPKSISTAAAGGTNIDVTLDNPSPVATKVQYQISTDGGSNWGSVTDAPSTTAFQVSASGTVKIRVRNYNSTGVSDWLESGVIVTLCPPDPPTLISPSNSAVLTTGDSVTFQWRHNAPDGSAQTAAQLQYSTDGGDTWTTVTKSTEQSHTMANPWSAGTTVTWRVRTKGADASYGAYAQAFSFKVYSAPTVSITSPGATITGMPLSVSANYTDASGTCQAATVTLTQGGRKLYSESATPGATISASIDVSEFLPTNGESYTVVLTARSSSGLTASANATFQVAYTEPPEGTLQVVNDDGTASLYATFDNTGADAPAVSISVARMQDGTPVPLITDGASGSGFVDRYAPLNTPYQYAVTTKAASGAVNTVYVDNIIKSDYWYVYWGDNAAKAKWNPENGGIQITRPSKTRVYYAGRRDPVSYDGHAVALTETPSWMFINKDEVDLFVQLIEDGGRGVYKSCDGWVYHADFDLTLTPAYTAIGYYGGASLGITRIAGERL